MSAAVIFVDNLRIGGFQRLALDEAYGLSDQGVACNVITLEDPINMPSDIKYFSSIEAELIEGKGIQVRVFPNSRRALYRNIKNFLKETEEPALLISHSLRATFALKLVKFTTPSVQIVIKTKIHQIPSLIDINQRIKRFIYAQFSDQLFCFSEAVRVSWGSQFGRGIPGIDILTKRITLLRNGIYLPRLPKMSTRPEGEISNPRLIFLGRLTFWKGLEILERIAREKSLSNFNFLFVIPVNDERSLKEISHILGDRMEVIVGRSVGELQLYPGDVHLYPTQYGVKSLVTESISLNCLEMVGIGIPSVITLGGQLSWNEPEFSEVFFETDWKDITQVVSQITKASEFKMNSDLHGRLSQLISIDNELAELQK